MTYFSRNRMGSTVTRVALLLAVAAMGAMQLGTARLEDTRADGLKAIKDGDFSKGTALLNKAAEASSDPQVRRYAAWAGEYEAARQVLVKDRRVSFEKSLDDVKKLVADNDEEAAIEFAANRTYVYAEDKQKFTDSPLAQELIAKATAMAAGHESASEWIKAQRLYSDLSILEPSEPKWKDHLKSVIRRVRMLAMYCPEVVKAQRAEDAKLAAHIRTVIADATTRPTTEPASGPTTEAVMAPSTAPSAGAMTETNEATTEPTSRPDDDVADTLKLDWKDSLRGIKGRNLMQGLIDVRSNYWRDLDFAQVVVGGLEGVQTLITTQSIDKTFPGIADAAKRGEFLAQLDKLKKQMHDAAADKSTEVLTANRVYTELLAVNQSTVAIPEEVVVYEFGDAALAECDPFTNMIWPASFDEFNKTTQGEFAGVGIQIQSDDDGSLKVVSPLEDSPAFRAGIKAGDVITHVNGKAVKGITTDQAVRIITGKPGSPVTLTIRSIDNVSRDYVLKRETIRVSSLKGFVRKPGGAWDYFIDPENKIAYIRLTGFSSSTSADLMRATTELQQQGVRGMVLDLRYNPGGLLTAAIEVVNRFIDHGLIVATHPDRKTGLDATAAYAHPESDGVRVPLVVMVNQYSASASEIVSGALKDQGRAVIVGERSFGKGSVQQLFQVGGGSDKTVIKLTTAHYYLPSGRCLHRDEDSRVWGVDPDVKVEMTPEQMYAANRARADFDVLRAVGEQATTGPATRSVSEMTENLLKTDSQLGAALLLLRLQLNGAQVAEGTPAPGVPADAH